MIIISNQCHSRKNNIITPKDSPKIHVYRIAKNNNASNIKES